MGDGLRILEEKFRDGLAQEKEDQGRDQAEGRYQPEACPIAPADPVMLLGSEVLGHEGVDGGCKTVGSHPGQALHLDSQALGCHGQIAKADNNPGDEDGDRGMDNRTGRDRQAQFGNGLEPVDIQGPFDQGQFGQELIPPDCHEQEYKGGQFRQEGGQGSPGHIQPQAQDKKRVQDHIEDKAADKDHEGGETVAGSRQDSAVEAAPYPGDEPQAHDPQIGFRPADGLQVIELEDGRQRAIGKKEKEAEKGGQEIAQAQGRPGPGPGLSPFPGTQGLPHQDLAAHPGDGKDTVHQPEEGTAGPYGRQRPLAQGGDPIHIGHGVGQAHKRSGHDGHGQLD